MQRGCERKLPGLLGLPGRPVRPGPPGQRSLPGLPRQPVYPTDLLCPNAEVASVVGTRAQADIDNALALAPLIRDTCYILEVTAKSARIL